MDNQRRLAAATLMMGAMMMPSDNAALAAEFDRQAWQAGRGDDSGRNPRGAQVTALRAMLRPGMPRAEVHALLGQPENVNGAREMYSLGTGFGASLEYFAVEYDGQGQMVRNSLVRG